MVIMNLHFIQFTAIAVDYLAHRTQTDVFYFLAAFWVHLASLIIHQVPFERRSDQEAPEARDNDADFLYQPSGSPVRGAALSACHVLQIPDGIPSHHHLNYHKWEKMVGSTQSSGAISPAAESL